MRVSRVFVLGFVISLFTFFIPPQTPVIIGIFILLLGIFFYSIFRFYFSKKYSLLIALFIAALLLLKALQLFDTINAILLVSLFVGLFALIK